MPCVPTTHTATKYSGSGNCLVTALGNDTPHDPFKKTTKCFAGGVRSSAFIPLMLYRSQNQRPGIVRFTRARPRYHYALGRKNFFRRVVADDPIAAKRITRERQSVSLACKIVCKERIPANLPKPPGKAFRLAF